MTYKEGDIIERFSSKGYKKNPHIEIARSYEDASKDEVGIVRWLVVFFRNKNIRRAKRIEETKNN